MALADVVRSLNLFLAHKTFRAEMGGTPRRGLLFEGPPGTGKTYLARAMAREAGVPFLFVSATSFQSMWYGASAKKIRSYFKALRKAARKEGGASAPGLQTNILLIAATNRADSLDPALLRPGRFDRRVTFEMPAKAGRRELVDHFLSTKAHTAELDDPELRDTLAGVTQGYSPVMIEHLLDEALVNAVRRGQRQLTWSDVEKARLVEEVGLGQPVGSRCSPSSSGVALSACSPTATARTSSPARAPRWSVRTAWRTASCRTPPSRTALSATPTSSAGCWLRTGDATPGSGCCVVDVTAPAAAQR